MKLKKVFNLKQLIIAIISLSIILSPTFLTQTIKADSLNFDFEDGINQWTTYEDVTTVGAETINTQDYVWLVEPNSNAMAQLVPSGPEGVVNDMFTVLGLSQDTKDYITGQFPAITNCAYIYRDIELQAGQTLSMAWNYISTDYVPFNDASLATFVNLTNSSKVGMINGYYGEAGILGATVPGTGNYSTGSYGSTGWQMATFRAVYAGTYRLGFAVYNLDDTVLSPYLFLDDPEGLTFKNGDTFDPIEPDGEAPPPPEIKSVTYSQTSFDESSDNDGSVDDTSTITVMSDTFAGSVGEELPGVNFSNLPQGLTAHIIKTSDTTATLSFTGNALEHSSSADISNFTVVFSNTSFTGNDAANVAGATTDYISISFLNPTYTLAYIAGSNGSITGQLSQNVQEGANGSAVTAVANEGYHFTQWSDGVTTAQRTDTNITQNMTVTAQFSPDVYTLTYTSDNHGSLQGDLTQSVERDCDGTTVTAVADEGYHFTQWSDGITTAERTDTVVKSDITVTAQFAPDVYTLTYTAGNHGSLQGDLTQSVERDCDGTTVTAIADEGYHFTQWSDGVATAQRTDTVVKSNITITAQFSPDVYTLTYLAENHGKITGNNTQSIERDCDGSAVTAVADEGYHFTQWSDGITTAERTDTVIKSDIAVTAQFAPDVYTLTYTAGEHGSLQGTLTQSVERDCDGTAVTAVADEGYIFMQWSDGITKAIRTDKNIKNNISVTALFAKKIIPVSTATYEVQHYKQDANGEYILSETETFTGNIGQTVTARAKAYAEYELNTTYEGAVNSGTVLSDNSLVLKLYYNKVNTRLVVEVNDNNAGFNIEGVDKNINIGELNNENVSKVIISLQVNVLNTESLSEDVIKKAEELLQKEGLTPYNYFDLSLIKSVFDKNGNVVESKVLNSDITGELTIRIPVPDDLKNTDNLAIVFVNDAGEVQVLKTDIVTIDGKKYLEFKTTHFSIYGIVQTEKSYTWIWIIAGALIIAAAAILIYKKKKQNA